MVKPSLCLSLLTAIVAAELTTLSANASRTTRSTTYQSSPITSDELTEEQRINDEARRSLGKELLGL